MAPQGASDDGDGAKSFREWATLFLAVVGAGLGIAGFVRACSTERNQRDFQDQVEERSSAPVLAAGVEPAKRLGEARVRTQLGVIRKPAQSPVIRRRGGVVRLIVPVWNVGGGLAVVRKAVPLQDCEAARAKEVDKPLQKLRRLGYYNVAAGTSEQLVYPITADAADRATTSLFVLVRYTDPLVRRDRWTCIEWARGGPSRDWNLVTQNYNDRELQPDGS
jgi:hypothetical protein